MCGTSNCLGIHSVMPHSSSLFSLIPSKFGCSLKEGLAVQSVLLQSILANPSKLISSKFTAKNISNEDEILTKVYLGLW